MALTNYSIWKGFQSMINTFSKGNTFQKYLKILLYTLPNIPWIVIKRFVKLITKPVYYFVEAIVSLTSQN